MIRMALGLFLIALPVLEIVVLIKTGQMIGFWATLGLVIGAGAVGSLILSRQSVGAFQEAMQAASEGRPPTAPVLNGLFLMLAGGLLLMPGLISDGLALLLMIPPLRHAVARWTMHRIISSAEVSEIHGDERSVRRPPAGRGPLIEGEFERLDERPGPPPRRNGQAQE
jgi:UPF0716 protein FxsA